MRTIHQPWFIPFVSLLLWSRLQRQAATILARLEGMYGARDWRCTQYSRGKVGYDIIFESKHKKLSGLTILPDKWRLT